MGKIKNTISKNVGILIAIPLLLELLVFGLRFINIKSDKQFYPEENITSQVDGSRYLDKINSFNSGTGAYGLNSGVLTNSENINGYNPIFPKRLLWVVNAAEGRDSNFVESVSVNLTNSDNKIYQIAGANKIMNKDGSISYKEKPKNIYFSVKVIEDDDLFNLIKDNKIEPDKVIYIKSSDRDLANNIPEEVDVCQSVEVVPTIRETTYQLSVKSDCDFYYVFPYSFFPGWEAVIGGTKIKPFPAFGFLQGYYFSKGDYNVTLRYAPSFFRLN
jgi:hypothetical protein